MNEPVAAEDDASPEIPPESFLQRHPRLRRELYILGSALAVGLFLMPTLIYVAGVLTLGPYANGGWVALFGDVYIGLFRGWWPAWSVVLGPLTLVLFVRGTAFLYRRFLRPAETD